MSALPIKRNHEVLGCAVLPRGIGPIGAKPNILKLDTLPVPFTIRKVFPHDSRPWNPYSLLDSCGVCDGGI